MNSVVLFISSEHHVKSSSVISEQAPPPPWADTVLPPSGPGGHSHHPGRPALIWAGSQLYRAFLLPGLHGAIVSTPDFSTPLSHCRDPSLCRKEKGARDQAGHLTSFPAGASARTRERPGARIASLCMKHLVSWPKHCGPCVNGSPPCWHSLHHLILPGPVVSPGGSGPWHGPEHG